MSSPSVGFMDAVKKAFAGYCDYASRSRRSEYWFFVLFDFLVIFAVGLIFGVIFGLIGIVQVVPAIVAIVELVLFFGFMLPLSVRRLHDTGKSGWFILLGLIPFVGGIILLIFFCLDSQPETNEYGPSPKYSGSPGNVI